MTDRQDKVILSCGNKEVAFEDAYYRVFCADCGARQGKGYVSYIEAAMEATRTGGQACFMCKNK